MKKIFLLIFTALLINLSAAAQATLPERCVVFYPNVLQSSTVLKESDVNKLMKSYNFGQKGIMRSKRFWIVYSDRDNNVTYTEPGGTTRHSVLNLNDKLRIAQVTMDGYALVYSEPVEDIAYPMISQYAESKGWIHVDKLLLWHSCLANESGIYNKALLCVNLNKQRGADLGKLYANPENREKYETLETNMNFYYVMKREGNLSLLASTHKMDGISDKVLLGWVAEQSYVAWNQRSCLEMTWDKDDVEHFARRGEIVNIFEDSDLKQITTTLKYNVKEGGAQDKYFYRMHPDFLRFPLLDNGTDNLYNCSAFMTAGGKSFTISNDDSGALTDSENKLRELTNINIGIVIDGTRSMKDFYSPVQEAVSKGVKFFGDRYNVKVGAVIYRDYTDGEYVTEKCRLTHPENPALERFLSDGGNYGIKSNSRDKTSTEAMYMGIDVALDQLGFIKGQTNLILVVGDCGNNRNDKRISEDDLIAKLVEKNVHVMGFQVRRKSHDAYELFTSQMIDLMRKSLEVKYKMLNEGVKVELRETKDGYTLENNVKSNIYIGTHNYPELNTEMPLSVLSDMIQEAIRYSAESARNLVDVLTKFNTGTWGFKTNRNSVNTDIDINEDWLRNTLGDDYETIKNSNSLLAFQGYVKKEDEDGHKYFKPVVFISSDELNSLIERLAEVNNAAVAETNDREPYVNALKALAQAMAPEGYTEQDIAAMKPKQIMARITGLNETPDALKGYTIQEIASHRVSHAEYRKMVEDFKRKFRKLQDLKTNPYKYTRTLGDSKYYWLPIEDLP